MRSLTLCVLLSVAVCDRRVSEPERHDAPTTKTQPTTSAPVTTVSNTSDRCVHPTPAEPARPAPPAGPAPGCPDDPGNKPELRRAEVRFKEAGKTVRVEMAEREAQRLRGLMYRTELPEDEGMLFVFQGRTVHPFWMKNTCLPLDMLFIDEDGFIVGIEENVPTLNESNYSVPCPSKYVLEVNAGWTRRHGVRAGQYVELPGH